MDKGKIYNTNSDTNDDLHVVIERLKSLQKYDIASCADDWGNSTLEVDACDDEYAEWVKVEDVEKIIKELNNAL